jgi:hypothetical protein
MGEKDMTGTFTKLYYHIVFSTKSHHRERDFKTELIGLLDKHDVEYDERYLWD